MPACGRSSLVVVPAPQSPKGFSYWGFSYWGFSRQGLSWALRLGARERSRRSFCTASALPRNFCTGFSTSKPSGPQSYKRGSERSGRREAGARKREQRSSASKSGRRPPASLLPAQGGQRLVPPRLIPTEEPCPSGRAMCTRKDHMRHALQENVLARKYATCCGRPPQTRCGHASGERVPG